MKERIDLTQFDWMEHHSIKHMEDCGDLAIVDVNAIQMIPELIAELKKTYKEIDDLRTGLDMAHKCLADHNFRQCHECGDHYHDDYGPLCGHIASK